MNAKQQPQQKNEYNCGIQITMHQQNTYQISWNKENTSQTGSNWLIHSHSGLISSFFANVHTPSHKSSLKKCHVIPAPTYRAWHHLYFSIGNFHHLWLMSASCCIAATFLGFVMIVMMVMFHRLQSMTWPMFSEIQNCSPFLQIWTPGEWTVVGDSTFDIGNESKFKAWNHIHSEFPLKYWTIPHDYHQNVSTKKLPNCQVAQGSPLAGLRSWRLEDSMIWSTSCKCRRVWPFPEHLIAKNLRFFWSLCTFSVDSEC